MHRFLIATAFLVGANALGLLITAVLLEDMKMNFGSFVLAVVIFTLVTALARPFIMKLAMRYFDALMGATALVSTLVGLILTSLLTDGLSIRGAGTWALATIGVWFIATMAGVILPMLVLKRGARELRDRSAPR